MHFSSFEWRQAQSDTAMRTYSGGLNLQAVPQRSLPQNLAQTSDGPPTQERSGSEHRVGRFSSSSLRGEDRDERWSLP